MSVGGPLGTTRWTGGGLGVTRGGGVGRGVTGGLVVVCVGAAATEVACEVG